MGRTLPSRHGINMTPFLPVHPLRSAGIQTMSQAAAAAAAVV